MGNLNLDKKIEKLSSGELFAFIKVTGSIDGSNVKKFEQEALKILEKGIKFLVLNFSQLNYMNSTGMGMMVKVLDSFREIDGEMKLVQVPPKILELFNLLGIASVFSIYKSNMEALNSLPHCIPSDFLDIVGEISGDDNRTQQVQRMNKTAPELRAPTMPVSQQPTRNEPKNIPPVTVPAVAPIEIEPETPELEAPYEIKAEGSQNESENHYGEDQYAGKSETKSRTAKPFYRKLLDKQRSDTHKSPGFQGYKLDTFLQFSARSDGLQPGLYVIAGQTDIGKTALLNNLFLDVIASNERIRGIYYNLEGSWEDTSNQFLAISSFLNLRQVTRKQEGEEKVKLDIAYQDLLAYSKTGRLSVKEVAQYNSLLELEREIQENDSYELFIAINGAQNWAQEIPNFYSQLRRLAYQQQIPIVVTVPLSQPYKNRSDIVFLEKAGQLADMIWILHPRDEKFYVQSESLVIVEFAKNKKSSYKGRIFLHFFKNQGKMKEIIETKSDGSQTRQIPKTNAFTRNNPESNQ